MGCFFCGFKHWFKLFIIFESDNLSLFFNHIKFVIMKKLLLIGIFFSLCLLGFSQGNRTPGMKKQTGLLVPTVTIQTVTVSPGAVVLPVHGRIPKGVSGIGSGHFYFTGELRFV